MLTEGLLDVSPILVNSFHLLCSLWVGCLSLLVLSEELLQSVYIETSCLPVDERSRNKHLVGTLLEDVLNFLVCNG